MTLPRKEAFVFSLSGEVGAEVVRLEGRGGGGAAVFISCPSFDWELGRGDTSRGELIPSPLSLK